MLQNAQPFASQGFSSYRSYMSYRTYKLQTASTTLPAAFPNA
jgi:hypothetical protein